MNMAQRPQRRERRVTQGTPLDYAYTGDVAASAILQSSDAKA
jgi:hypothetical protein